MLNYRLLAITAAVVAALRVRTLSGGLILFFVLAFSLYLVLLERRLQGSHPDSVPFTAAPVSDKELLSTTYDLSHSWTHNLPPPQLDGVHVVIGGSGSLGAAVCRILVERGQRVRIVDVQPPDPTLTAHDRVDFVKANIAVESEVQKAFVFSPEDQRRAELVVYHTAASIRFYERLAYVRDLSDAVNVRGTQHVVDAVRAQTTFKAKQLIYISSAAACVHQPNYLRLRRPASPIMSDDFPLSDRLLNTNHYNRSKREAEALVRDANGPGLRTASLRLGMGVVGPRDIFIRVYLTKDVIPIWGQDLVHHTINVFDAGRAMVCCENKLRHAPEGVAGQAFLVTGKGMAWTFREFRRATEVMARRKLPFVPVPVSVLLLASYLVEFFFYARFHLLSWLRFAPAPVPKWAQGVGLDMLFFQPSTFDTASSDMIVLDRRARERLGYEPVWDTPQTIKWCTDVVEASKASGAVWNWI